MPGLFERTKKRHPLFALIFGGVVVFLDNVGRAQVLRDIYQGINLIWTNIPRVAGASAYMGRGRYRRLWFRVSVMAVRKDAKGEGCNYCPPRRGTSGSITEGASNVEAPSAGTDFRWIKYHVCLLERSLRQQNQYPRGEAL